MSNFLNVKRLYSYLSIIASYLKQNKIPKEVGTKHMLKYLIYLNIM